MRTKDRICNISALKHTFSTLCPSCCAAASCSPSAAAPGDANDSVTFTSTEPAALQPLCWVAALKRWHIKVKLDVSQGVSTRHVDFLNTVLHYPNMKPPRWCFYLDSRGPRLSLRGRGVSFHSPTETTSAGKCLDSS